MLCRSDRGVVSKRLTFPVCYMRPYRLLKLHSVRKLKVLVEARGSSRVRDMTDR